MIQPETLADRKTTGRKKMPTYHDTADDADVAVDDDVETCGFGSLSSQLAPIFKYKWAYEHLTALLSL
jgi:hypothetical protein